MKVFENNQATLNGEIVSGFEFSHELHGEKFYAFKLAVTRTSNVIDTLPVMVSERLIDANTDRIGETVSIKGNTRTYNKQGNDKRHLLTYVFVQEIESADGADATNNVFLNGFIVKPPIYRKTPLGRDIADMLIAVHRPYGKSDYIPCIAWGRNARWAEHLEVGARLKVKGRIQSREYVKQLSDDESEVRTAYEVSIKSMKTVDDERKGEKYEERIC